MSKKILQDQDYNSQSRIRNLLSPTNSDEPATKAYVDSSVEGLNWKDSVLTASTANINLASPGGTIGGVGIGSGQHFLAKNQTAPEENGIYVHNGPATLATRRSDSNTAADLEQAIVTVEEGTNSGTNWRQTEINFILDSEDVTWTSFGTAASAASETTAGIAELATQAETDTGTDDLRIVTPLKLTNFANKKLKATGTIGDGAATQIDITHNFNTRNVTVAIYRNSTPWDDVECDIERPDANTVRTRFSAAPSAAQFAYVILG